MKTHRIMPWLTGLITAVVLIATAPQAAATAIPVHDPNCTKGIKSTVTGALACFYFRHTAEGQVQVDLDSYLKDTNNDGKRASAWIKYDFLEAGAWRPVMIELSSVSDQGITQISWHAQAANVRNIRIRACNATSECDAWQP